MAKKRILVIIGENNNIPAEGTVPLADPAMFFRVLSK
jgi:hypothetical protein